MKDVVQAVHEFIENNISFDTLINILRKNAILYNKNKNKFNLRIHSYFGRFGAKCLNDIINVVRDYVEFIHITTKQNIEIQNIGLEDIPNVVSQLDYFGVFNKKLSVSDFISISYLSGINPEGVFDITDFSVRLSLVLSNLFVSKDFHPKFRIGISDCHNDLGLASVSDIGLIAKIENGKKGFQVLVGGALGELPKRAETFIDFSEYDECFKYVVAIMLYVKKFGKVRIKDIIARECFSKYEIENIKNGVDISHLESGDNFVEFSSESVDLGIDYPIRCDGVVFKNQKQSDMFYIETVCDGGDFDLNFVKLLCFISSKFGDGKIIINNRQNFVVPNITITNSYEVKNIFRIFNVKVFDRNTSNIVACTGNFSCNLAIVDSKDISRRIRECVGDTGVNVNFSACPNSSGHHHLGDIGVFTISRSRGKNKILGVIVFGGYGLFNKLPIGRAFAKVPIPIVPMVVKGIIDCYKSSSFLVFQDFVKDNWRELKIKIFDILLDYGYKGSFFYDGLPIRTGSKLDMMFLDLFDIEFVTYKVLKKFSGRDGVYLKMLDRCVRGFIDKVKSYIDIHYLGFPESSYSLLEYLFDVEVILESNIETIRNKVIMEEEYGERNSVYSG